MTPQRVLIIEDEHALSSALEMQIRRMGHIPQAAATATSGIEALKKSAFAAVVLDIGLPDFSGLDALKTIRKGNVAIPVLIITAHATLEHAISAQKYGATGYLTKPLDLKKFEDTLNAMLSPKVSLPKPAIEINSASLIGAAASLRDAFVAIAKACSGKLPALITGESGTGKTLAAGVIHKNGSESKGRIDFYECADLRDLDFLGADSGTVVFEEISNLDQQLQKRLCDLLSTQANAMPRILATTKYAADKLSREEIIRPDLFYALATLTIPLPPLRERAGDVPALSSFFLSMHTGANNVTLTPPVLAALQAYEWPGNIRELRHVLEYAVSVGGGENIYLNHLPDNINAKRNAFARGELEVTVKRWLDGATFNEAECTYDNLMGELESTLLRLLMKKYEGKPTHLAMEMKINRATLRQKLRRYGLSE